MQNENAESLVQKAEKMPLKVLTYKAFSFFLLYSSWCFYLYLMARPLWPGDTHGQGQILTGANKDFLFDQTVDRSSDPFFFFD